MNNLPIGMIDSGVGGLSIFLKISEINPNQSLYYFADSAHFPYGQKSQEEIVDYCLENVAFLLEQRIKLLVIACVTASSLALDPIQSLSPVPVLNIVDSLIEQLMESKYAEVAILGTKATIDSGFIQSRLANCKVYPLSCSELVTAVEQGDTGSSLSLLESYGEYFAQNDIDTVLLACTHFGHLLPLMRKCWGDQLNIIDGSEAMALKIASLVPTSGDRAEHTLFTTGDLSQFASQVSSILPHPLPKMEQVSSYLV